MTTHAHFKGEFSNVAYRTARAVHYASRAAKAAEAHATALKSGNIAEAARHSVIAAVMSTRANSHASAVIKLAPDSEHASTARSAKVSVQRAQLQVAESHSNYIARGRVRSYGAASIETGAQQAEDASKAARHASYLAKDLVSGSTFKGPIRTQANLNAAEAHHRASEAHMSVGNEDKAREHAKIAREHEIKATLIESIKKVK